MTSDTIAIRFLRIGLIATVCLLLTQFAFISNGKAQIARRILDPLSGQSSFCIHLGVSDGKLTTALSARNRNLVHGLAVTEAKVDQARRWISSQDLVGIVTVEKASMKKLPYADNLANLVLVSDFASLSKLGLTLEEIKRVVRPDGIVWFAGINGGASKTALAQAGFTNIKTSAANLIQAIKPRPKTMDTWTHRDRDASGNRVSAETGVGVPTGVRWVAGPNWPTSDRKAAVQEAVVSKKRLVYVIEDEIATSQGPKRENSLYARDAYNGLLLWRRKAFSLLAVNVGQHIYTINERGQLVDLDAQTGKTLRTFKVSRPQRMVHVDGLLLVSHSTGLSCFEAATGRSKWNLKDPVTTFLSGDGKVFVQSNKSRRGGENQFTCLSLTTGKQLWTHSTKSWLEKNAKLGSLDSLRLILYQDGLLVASSRSGNHGISAKDGSLLWTHGYKLIGHGGSFSKILYMNGLVWIHSAGSSDKPGYAWVGLEPMTGKEQKRLAHRNVKHRCSYDLATANEILSGSMDFINSKTGVHKRFDAARNSCRTAGLVPANGILYTFPHACGCYAMMRGFMGLETTDIPNQVLRDYGVTESNPVASKSPNTAGGIPVASGADDAEEDSKGKVTLGSSDLEMTRERTIQIIGLRFANVGVKRGAKISDCRIQFTVDETSSEATLLTIHAQASDNAPAFRSKTADISSRPKSNVSIYWKVNPWPKEGASGADQRTANLAPLINEITSRPNWKSGNAIVFIISGKGKRTAVSADKSRSATRLILNAENLGAPKAKPQPVAVVAKSMLDRLERGPAYAKIPAAVAVSDSDWPTYRHDAQRTGSTAGKGPAKLTPLWQQIVRKPAPKPWASEWAMKDGGNLSSAAIAGKTVYVAATDAHQMRAYDVATGKLRWSYQAGARIDCPPTIYKGLCLFGSRDGWAYCLIAKTGQLVWRFRAAPTDRRIVAYGQMESSWPVVGGVLIYDGLAYIGVGRHAASDGGIFVHAVEPKTGKLIWAQTPRGYDGVPDVLNGDKGTVQMASWEFHAKTGANKRISTSEARMRGGRLGLLNDAWYRRPIATRKGLQGWTAAGRPTSQIATYGKSATAGFRTSKTSGGNGAQSGDSQLFGQAVSGSKQNWQIKLPTRARVRGMVLAGDQLYVAGRFDDKGPNRVRLYSMADGKLISEAVINEPLIHDCLAVAGGRLFVSTHSGKLICFADK